MWRTFLFIDRWIFKDTFLASLNMFHNVVYLCLFAQWVTMGTLYSYKTCSEGHRVTDKYICSQTDVQILSHNQRCQSFLSENWPGWAEFHKLRKWIQKAMSSGSGVDVNPLWFLTWLMNQCCEENLQCKEHSQTEHKSAVVHSAVH